MYRKTADLADQFGYCTRTMIRICKEMVSAGYPVIIPIGRGGTYRAEPEAVKDYLLNRKELKKECGHGTNTPNTTPTKGHLHYSRKGKEKQWKTQCLSAAEIMNCLYRTN